MHHFNWGSFWLGVLAAWIVPMALVGLLMIRPFKRRELPRTPESYPEEDEQ